jgi:hypothetical protein
MDFSDEGSALSASSGNDPSSGRAEAYGPIELRRYVKSDGRVLILYTHGGSAQEDGPVQGGSASE